MAPTAASGPISPIERSIRSALDKVGSTGHYQKTIIVIFSFSWVLITYSTMINSYIFMNPLFICNDK